MTTVAEQVTALDAKLKSFFDTLISATTSQTLANLPLIGDATNPVAEKVAAYLTGLKNDISAKLQTVSDATAPAGLATAINDLGLPYITAAADPNDAAKVVITVAKNLTDNLDVLDQSLNLGLFQLHGGFKADVAADLTVKFSFDTGTLGFAYVNGNGPEFNINLDAAVDYNSTGDLGLLHLDLTDTLPLTTPEINLDFAVDIAGLSLADITHALTGSAETKFHIETSLLQSDLLPKITSDLVYDWAFGGTQTAVPFVKFSDVTVDVGGILDKIGDMLRPVMNFFSGFPFEDLLDALTTPLPIVDELAGLIGLKSPPLPGFDSVPLPGGDKAITLLDLAGLYYFVHDGPDSPNLKILSNFAEALTLIKKLISLNEGNDGRLIHLGDFTVSGVDPAGTSTALPGPAGFFAPQATPGIGQITAPSQGSPVDQLNSAVANDPQLNGNLPTYPGVGGGGPSPLDNGLLSNGGSSGAKGLSIPILEHPEQLFGLLVSGGQQVVDLIKYDVPPLQLVDIGFEQYFPVVGPIGITLGGKFSAGIDFAVGYDTRGLTTNDLLDGIFITTDENPADPQGFAPAATVGVEITAAATVSIAIAELKAGGGLRAGLNMYLNDGNDTGPNADPGDAGKLRASTIATGCIFEPITGKFSAFVFVELTIDFGFFDWSERITLADVDIADFSFGCPDSGGRTVEGHGLATVYEYAQSDMYLNAGTRAFLREIVNENGPTAPGTDGDEAFHVANGQTERLDSNGIPIKGDFISLPGVLTVSAFGIEENYGSAANPVEIIKADMGAGADIVTIANDVQQKAILFGGSGNDTLTGGGGNDELHGGTEKDTLEGRGGDDQLWGDDGDDRLDGGAGADRLDGGAGYDQVSYAESAVGVTFAAPINGVSTGSGGDAQGDQLISIEYIIGSNFNDVIYGNPFGNSADKGNTLEGRGGDDKLYGGSARDFILGGAGADYMNGFGGRDATSYVTSWGSVVVDLIKGKGFGGDAEGDTLISIEDVYGSFQSDQLYGNSADNTLRGWGGNDVIDGNGGADELLGDDGDDAIYARGDETLLDGGAGRDLLTYSKIGSTFFGNGWDVNLQTGKFDGDSIIAMEGAGNSSFEDLDGSRFNDVLTGDDQANRIRGLGDDDEIHGGGGNDTLIGGIGGDELHGDAGRDLADYENYVDLWRLSAATSNTGVTADLTATVGLRNTAQGDTFDSIENLRGTVDDDILIGDGADNEIDPGLSTRNSNTLLGALHYDYVDGRGGQDRLVVDYMNYNDIGTAMVGGFALGSTTAGDFRRFESSASAVVLDGVDFVAMESLRVRGTIKGDTIYGGALADEVYAGGGNDTYYSGGGADFASLEFGNDIAFVNTDANRVLAANGGTTGNGFFDAGADIDTLNVSLAGVTSNVVISGGDPAVEFVGTNYSGQGGTFRNFEKLGEVRTGSGDDEISQPGNVDNVFRSGDGYDVLRPGLGHDTVDGGFDFVFGRELGFGEFDLTIFNQGTVILPTITNYYSNSESGLGFADNPGDLLVLDYSTYASAPVVGQVTMVDSALELWQYDPAGQGVVRIPLKTNNGNYHATNDGTSVDFTEIERIDVTGTNLGDVLVGTYDSYEPGLLNDNDGILDPTERGDDWLRGLDGDDWLIGYSGSDHLIGGNGADKLIGADPATANIFPEVGSTILDPEVDTLTGGAGADLFVLGTAAGPFYKDNSSPSMGDSSRLSRAVITDFNPLEGDRIQLGGNPDSYSLQLTFDGAGIATTRILYRPGDGIASLIGEVQNFAGLDLTAGGPHVVYSTAASPGPGDIPTGGPTPAGGAAAAAFQAPAAGGGSWISQNNDPVQLLQTLFGPGNVDPTGLLTQSIVLQGDGRAFGIIDGSDPFGIGRGIGFSTGIIEQLDNPNLKDGYIAGYQGSDLITDFGQNGTVDDEITMTYTFEVAPGADVDTLVFDFVFMSEEFPEWGGTRFNDRFAILLNGVNMAYLNDDPGPGIQGGATVNVNNLVADANGPYSDDFILNLAFNGPAKDETAVDGFTKILHAAGALQAGTNTLEIVVADVGDGIFDTAVMIKADTFTGRKAPVLTITPIPPGEQPEGTVGADTPVADIAATGDATSNLVATTDDPRFVVVGGKLVLKGGSVLDFETSGDADPFTDGNQIIVNVSVDDTTIGFTGSTEATQQFVYTILDDRSDTVVKIDITEGGNPIREFAADDTFVATLGVAGLPQGVSPTFAFVTGGATSLISPDGRFEIVGTDIRVRNEGGLALDWEQNTSHTYDIRALAIGAGGVKIIDFTQSMTFFVDNVTPQEIVVGTDVRDVHIGDLGSDTMAGQGGDDELHGNAGADYLGGNGGNDSLFGDDGRDVLSGDAGADKYDGGGDDDTLNVDADDLSADMKGGSGFDYVYLDDSRGATFVFTDANEVESFVGNGGVDDIDATAMTTAFYARGSGANDILRLGSGGGQLYGNAGEDKLFGGAGYDLLFGGTEADRLEGGGGYNVMYGDEGDDTIIGGQDRDVMIGGAGRDKMSGGYGNDAAFMDGEDAIADIIGGDGFDDLYIAFSGSDIVLTDANGFEGVLGGGGNDVIDASGTSNVRYITGGAGRDTLSLGSAGGSLSGGADDDRLIGGSGANHMEGGTGADTFVIGFGPGADYVYDFNRAEGDKVDLSAFDTAFSALDFNTGVATGWIEVQNAADHSRIAMIHGSTLVAGDFVF